MSVRVYQLAKQLGVDNKYAIQLLRERGLDVKTPSSTIPTIYADALIEELNGKKVVPDEKKNDATTGDGGTANAVNKIENVNNSKGEVEHSSGTGASGTAVAAAKTSDDKVLKQQSARTAAVDSALEVNEKMAHDVRADAVFEKTNDAHAVDIKKPIEKGHAAVSVDGSKPIDSPESGPAGTESARKSENAASSEDVTNDPSMAVSTTAAAEKPKSGGFVIDLSKNIQLYKDRKSVIKRDDIIALRKQDQKNRLQEKLRTEVVERPAGSDRKPFMSGDRDFRRKSPFPSAYNQGAGRRERGPDVRFYENAPARNRGNFGSTASAAGLKIKPFLKKIEHQTHDVELKPLEVKLPIIVRDLAVKMDVKPFQLISKLMGMNVFASMNQELPFDTAQNVAEKFGYALTVAKEVVKVKKQQSQKKPAQQNKQSEEIVERAPVVCVLGHVDHGKTTLLDTIRNTRVAAGEAGGITQHVAAYQIEKSSKKITFIDTPGHAAFSKMRERGANMTDIGVLVVAADDGFMPQTDEALKFARNAGIPVIVAINKIDAKGANVDRVKQQMQQRGIMPEEWGGDTLCTEISALKNTNIDALLEQILLQAEMLELRADIASAPSGVILESKVATGQGPVASAIIQDGTLSIGNFLVCGQYYCKVKSIINDCGKQIKSAPAATPITIIGWSGLPDVGATFSSASSEKEARELACDNAAKQKQEADKTGKYDAEKIVSADQLFSVIAAEKEKSLNVVLRADVHGSAEALFDFLSTIKSDKIKLNILDCGVGPIVKNDITFASTSNAQIVAFNVKVEASAQALAKQLGVRIIQHNIIYEIIERVREAMAECLDPELRENKLGCADVRQIFNIKGSVIAGCMVTEGKVLRDKFARVIRNGEIIFQGKFASIKRQKDDASEVRAGFECGIVIAGFDLVAAGDTIECFEIEKIQPSL